MTTTRFESKLPSTQQELFDWHCRPGAFDRLAPPWQAIEMTRPAPVQDGSRAQIRLRKGPIWLSWTAEHRHVVEPQGFTDVQTRGPFARWVHRHEFEPAERGTLLRDSIDYKLPGGVLGSLFGGRSVAKDLESTFAFRHETTARDLARHKRFEHRRAMRIGITGATGLVGRNLCSFLGTGGHQPVALARSSRSGVRDPQQPDAARWSVDSGLLDPESIQPFDAVVHLAGESIASGRWTAERKRRIRDSRVLGTRNLVRSLGKLDRPPRTLVCASAIGYYGSRGHQKLAEESSPGDGFLAETCEAWEEAATEAERLGVRVVLLRFGIILTPAGGALAKMLPVFRLGAGGVLGSGDQYMSWISIDDAVGAVHSALLDDDLTGPINAVAPEPVTNREFTKTLGRVLGRPTFFPVPAAPARLLFGEMADEMLLSSARVLPARLEGAMFSFDDPSLEPALVRLLGKARWS